MNPHFPSGAQPIKLYRFALSGHSHRVELMLALLGLPVEIVDVNLAAGAHKTPEFLAINPFGQVPAIDDNGTVLADSNAILVYLAKSYGAGMGWLPSDAAQAGEVQSWLSQAAGVVANGPAAARLVTVFGAGIDHAAAVARAHGFLNVLEAHLEPRRFLVAERPTIADVAVYTYVAHAPEGGVSLDDYPLVRAWIGRIEALDGFVGMKKSPLPQVA